MKFTILTCLFLFLNFTNAFAENIVLENTESVCSKVNGFAVGDDLVIASSLSVPLSSIYFIGARWDYGKWGGKSCNFIFDTNKGPYNCNPFRILSGDNGKTAFGWIAGIGKNPTCWQ
jgi:hypothetical protein